MAKKKSDLTPIDQLSTMPTLKDTGGGLTDVNANLKSLKSVYHPGSLPAFQKVMQGISERVYAQRQSSEMGTLSGIMDPSKVSGGSFANALGWLEQARGKDVSTTYAASMNAYTQTQAQLSNDIQNLESMRYKMINDSNQFKNELVTKMPGVYETLSSSEKKGIDNGIIPASLYSKMDNWSKAVYDRELKWKEEDRAMENKINEMKLRQDDGVAQVEAFREDLSIARETLTKARDRGNYTALFNTIDDYNEMVNTFKLSYPKIDDSIIQSSLISVLSPEDQLKVINSKEASSQEKDAEKNKEKTKDMAKTLKYYQDKIDNGEELSAAQKKAYDQANIYFGSGF